MLKRVANPPNRFAPEVVEWIDAAPEARLEVYEEKAKSIVTSNNSPDICFTYSVNPYRGCFHACAYCYARPTHQYLDFGAGTDFERKLIAKVNAAELLEAHFMKPSWKGELLIFSGITDCYQPLEAHYQLTRGCLKVCSRYKNPVSIITKSALIRRDLDLLSELNARTSLRVNFSIAFADDKLSKLLEPGAPRPSTRFRAMKELADAGISVGIGVAPIIPGLTDTQVPELLERAAEAGATTAFKTLLRLPAEVENVFLERMQENVPERFKKVVNAVLEMKGGVLNRSEFGKRMGGEGQRWEAVSWMFEHHCKKLGLNRIEEDQTHSHAAETVATFERPTRQLALFS